MAYISGNSCMVLVISKDIKGLMEDFMCWVITESHTKFRISHEILATTCVHSNLGRFCTCVSLYCGGCEKVCGKKRIIPDRIFMELTCLTFTAPRALICTNYFARNSSTNFHFRSLQMHFLRLAEKITKYITWKIYKLPNSFSKR